MSWILSVKAGQRERIVRFADRALAARSFWRVLADEPASEDAADFLRVTAVLTGPGLELLRGDRGPHGRIWVDRRAGGAVSKLETTDAAAREYASRATPPFARDRSAPVSGVEVGMDFGQYLSGALSVVRGQWIVLVHLDSETEDEAGGPNLALGFRTKDATRAAQWFYKNLPSVDALVLVGAPVNARSVSDVVVVRGRRIASPDVLDVVRFLPDGSRDRVTIDEDTSARYARMLAPPMILAWKQPQAATELRPSWPKALTPKARLTVEAVLAKRMPPRVAKAVVAVGRWAFTPAFWVLDTTVRLMGRAHSRLTQSNPPVSGGSEKGMTMTRKMASTSSDGQMIVGAVDLGPVAHHRSHVQGEMPMHARRPPRRFVQLSGPPAPGVMPPGEGRAEAGAVAFTIYRHRQNGTSAVLVRRPGKFEFWLPKGRYDLREMDALESGQAPVSARTWALPDGRMLAEMAIGQLGPFAPRKLWFVEAGRRAAMMRALAPRAFASGAAAAVDHDEDTPALAKSHWDKTKVWTKDRPVAPHDTLGRLPTGHLSVQDAHGNKWLYDLKEQAYLPLPAAQKLGLVSGLTVGAIYVGAAIKAAKKGKKGKLMKKPPSSAAGPKGTRVMLARKKDPQTKGLIVFYSVRPKGGAPRLFLSRQTPVALKGGKKSVFTWEDQGPLTIAHLASFGKQKLASKLLGGQKAPQGVDKKPIPTGTKAPGKRMPGQPKMVAEQTGKKPLKHDLKSPGKFVPRESYVPSLPTTAPTRPASESYASPTPSESLPDAESAQQQDAEEQPTVAPPADPGMDTSSPGDDADGTEPPAAEQPDDGDAGDGSAVADAADAGDAPADDGGGDDGAADGGGGDDDGAADATPPDDGETSGWAEQQIRQRPLPVVHRPHPRRSFIPSQRMVAMGASISGAHGAPSLPEVMDPPPGRWVVQVQIPGAWKSVAATPVKTRAVRALYVLAFRMRKAGQQVRLVTPSGKLASKIELTGAGGMAMVKISSPLKPGAEETWPQREIPKLLATFKKVAMTPPGHGLAALRAAIRKRLPISGAIGA